MVMMQESAMNSYPMLPKVFRRFASFAAALLVFAGCFAFTALSCHAAADTIYSYAGTKWVSGEADGNGIDSGARYHTADGGVAYCLNEGRAAPNGTYYPDSYEPSEQIKAALYYGYPNVLAIEGYSLSEDQARCVTQLVVWAYNSSGYGHRLDMNSLRTRAGTPGGKGESQKVVDAAWALYGRAAGGLPDTRSYISQPADRTAQTFDGTYRRFGPFQVDNATNGFASLTGAPTGTYIGAAAGTALAGIPNATPFYVYVPISGLYASGTAGISVSADYFIPSVIAFTGKSGYQDMAKYYTVNAVESASATVSWSVATVVKQRTDAAQPVSDTAFRLERYVGGAWQDAGTGVTDGNGLLVFPGLGAGMFKITEIRANPSYGSAEESGQSPVRQFTISDNPTNAVQVFKNMPIAIGCEVDKDTIRVTSAAYQSLPGEEGIDNTDSETYHYDIDYRSTADVKADEFVVDDPLEAVSEDLIRVRELWTAVSWGDYDGLMNVWYKTNKTDDETVYSNVSAMTTNEANPNNPKKRAIYPNTGYKLWARDIPTNARTHLAVSDLGLEEDEYITAVRYEHGQVLKGFTTKNYADVSLNGTHDAETGDTDDADGAGTGDDGSGTGGDADGAETGDDGSGTVGDVDGAETGDDGDPDDATDTSEEEEDGGVVDWTPTESDRFYTTGAAHAVGLKPVTYLVSAPKPLAPPTIIASSVTARIA
ncbi:MAG: thioester domain-containing protein, partial [Clostridiales Family XIII bacterium]|nr:thioester domain-containing protein [Clostridiales Family XIII bacterium]